MSGITILPGVTNVYGTSYIDAFACVRINNWTYCNYVIPVVIESGKILLYSTLAPFNTISGQD